MAGPFCAPPSQFRIHYKLAFRPPAQKAVDFVGPLAQWELPSTMDGSWPHAADCKDANGLVRPHVATQKR